MSGFAERVLWAIQQLERAERVRKIENSEIGRRVAERLGRDEAYRSQTVGKWLESSEPSYDVTAALAAALGVDPGWLAFGEESLAPAPAGWEAPTPRASSPPEEAGAAALRRFDAAQKAAAERARRGEQRGRG